jgi:hypothetical protein
LKTSLSPFPIKSIFQEEEDSPFPALSSPSTPFFRLNLQTPQALNQESNPKQAYQNAIARLLLLSHNKKFHTHFPSNIQLSGQILRHLILKILQLQFFPA